MPIEREAAELETAIALGCEQLRFFLNNMHEVRRGWLGGIANDLCEFEPRVVPAAGDPEDLFFEWTKRLFRFVRTMRRVGLDRELCRAICLANDIGTSAFTKAAWAFSRAMQGVAPAQIAAMLQRQQDVGRVRNAMEFICSWAMRPKLLLGPTTAPTLESIRGRSEQLADRLKHSQGSGAKEFLYDAPDISAGIWAAMRQLNAKVPQQPKWAIRIEEATREQLDGLLDGQAWWTPADVETAIAEALIWCEEKTAEANSACPAAQVAEEGALPTHGAPAAEQVTDAPRLSETKAPDLRPFSGGTMVFHEDRVELCGIDICSGPRSQTKRKILELLAKKRGDGTFVAYGNKELAEQLKPEGGQVAIRGAIRDLRKDISDRLLRETNIACGRFEVIEKGTAGYQFCKNLTVQFDGDGSAAPITDIAEENNVRNHDVRNVRNRRGAERRGWILEQLTAGVQLRAPDVKKRFNCALKTAERDLQSLKDEGRVEFVGATRAGYYQLVQGAEVMPQSG